MAFIARVKSCEQLHIQSAFDRNGDLCQYKQIFSNKTYPQDVSSASIRPADEYHSVSAGYHPVFSDLQLINEVKVEISTLLKQPATRPISELQLINEVKRIYTGLVMVEKKCVEIVGQQANSTKRLENQQWKALVTLHRILLKEHHDFFTISQHPTTSDTLKRLAIKYAIPTRMRRYGIHAFPELLRHRLPDSMKYMLNFIYLVYSMMALLKESVPSFVESWVKCLGDLARHRMAMEDLDPRDKEIWSNVARTWYSEAADKSPIAEIQQYSALIATSRIVQQFLHYTTALKHAVRFINAKESIMLSFDMFGARISKSCTSSSTYAVFKSACADKIIQNVGHLISTGIVRALGHYSISRMTLLGFLLLYLPMTLALPTQPKPRVSDYNMHESILIIVSWVMFLGLSISIPFLRSRVHRDNQITIAVYPAYAASVAIICAGDTGFAALVKGLIQGCWLGFTIWYYVATTSSDHRKWIHVPLHLVLFLVVYQVLSTSRMGDAGMSPDLSPCIPYLSICLTVTIFAALSECSGRTLRLAERLRAAYAHENPPE